MWTALRNRGTAIRSDIARDVSVGDADLMIAATAVWMDYRVATRDLRSFPRINALDVVKW